MAAKSNRNSGPQLLDARPLRFDQKLVLNQWLISLFEVPNLEKLAEWLRDPEMEGFDADNISRFCYALRARIFDRAALPGDLLLAYDQNIVRHWRRITERRNRVEGRLLYPKYFQYLALLFTEIYLDRYFRDRDRLLADLNAHVAAFNAEAVPDDRVSPYQPDDLNKIAFWMATGSGKTLLMHVNILQYQHYLALHDADKSINRVILLTPNEGLSRQHLGEFALSGIEADIFSKDGRSLFAGRAVEILDIHKLADRSGEKTIAVEAFERNNLVLVDEGHRGASASEEGEWMRRRAELCADGFSFEYSATFGQAVKASGARNLAGIYARCILFDYSYKYFYNDGYGKEYRILNFENDTNEAQRQRYLAACLLAYYQQQKLYADHSAEFRPFLLERPLWIFVGGSVNAVRSQGGRMVSDVTDILLFLASFASPDLKRDMVALIEQFLRGQAGLLDTKSNDLFAGAYTYLVRLGLSAEQVYADILRVLYNAPAGGSLHVVNLKGTDGEIALHLGDHDPFGVINVGDAPKLCKLCESYPRALVVEEREFAGSLFHGINEGDSTINVLIGSKKFTEGWSSWRVSTMGLMNIGRTEGSEIIQLFGRGVRLKGRDFCLKRSRRIVGIHAPAEMERLETLNVFGIRADYMRQFREYLADEGLQNGEPPIEFVLPVLKNLGEVRLKTLRVKPGVDFKRQGPRPAVGPVLDTLREYPVEVNWYLKLQALASQHGGPRSQPAELHEAKFTDAHLAFLDFDAIYFELQRFKNERAWYNLAIPPAGLRDLLRDGDWYRLLIPADEMQFRSFEQVRGWQEIAVTLLTKYSDRYYKSCKAAFEQDHLEYADLAPDDGNFVSEYRILVEQSQDDIIAKLEEIKSLIARRVLRDVDFGKLRAIMFGQHLYQPLLYVNSELIEVRPVHLNEGERDFVLDLRDYYEHHRAFFAGRELYLLRNMSRGRGIGFFEAGNFYPDFILWLVTPQGQRIAFVDPKGIRNLEGMNDPKIRFHQTIKELEAKLGDPTVALSSFIISNTPHHQVAWWGPGLSKDEFEARNVLFQVEDRGVYVGTMLEKIVS
jgi:hypothetical protein